MLHFRLQLANINSPPVWRRLTVPDHFSFHRFHLVIQAAFGWENSHLYQFSENGYQSDWSISTPSEDEWREVKNSRKIRLSEVFHTKGQSFTYIYDFGDDWLHTIIVEDITDSDAATADCIAGKGACPPEDCGGAWGYEALKETMADPKHPEYKELRQWLGLKKGEEWNSAIFHISAAKKAVGRL